MVVPLWVRASAALIRAVGLVAGASSVHPVPFQIQVPFWKVPVLSSPPKSSDPPSVRSLVMAAFESPEGLRRPAWRCSRWTGNRRRRTGRGREDDNRSHRDEGGRNQPPPTRRMPEPPLVGTWCRFRCAGHPTARREAPRGTENPAAMTAPITPADDARSAPARLCMRRSQDFHSSRTVSIGPEGPSWHRSLRQPPPGPAVQTFGGGHRRPPGGRRGARSTPSEANVQVMVSIVDRPEGIARGRVDGAAPSHREDRSRFRLWPWRRNFFGGRHSARLSHHGL